MIVSDAGAGAATVVLAAMFIFGEPTVLGLAVVAAVSSAFAALQWPAYQAATTLLVPPRTPVVVKVCHACDPNYGD